MIIKKFFGLLNLIETEIFYIYKVTKIIMFDKNNNFMFAIFKVMMPNFKIFKNG